MRKQIPREVRLLQVIGRQLAYQRGLSGINQSELARRIHVSRSQVCKHESGQANMSVGRLISICQTIGIKPTDFLKLVIDVADVT